MKVVLAALRESGMNEINEISKRRGRLIGSKFECQNEFGARF